MSGTIQEGHKLEGFYSTFEIRETVVNNQYLSSAIVTAPADCTLENFMVKIFNDNGTPVEHKIMRFRIERSKLIVRLTAVQRGEPRCSVPMINPANSIGKRFVSGDVVMRYVTTDKIAKPLIPQLFISCRLDPGSVQLESWKPGEAITARKHVGNHRYVHDDIWLKPGYKIPVIVGAREHPEIWVKFRPTLEQVPTLEDLAKDDRENART